MQKILGNIIKSLWLLLSLAMVIGFVMVMTNTLNITHSMPALLFSVVLPYLVLVLSLYVFNRTPSPFRVIHHGFILAILFVSLALVYKFTFHGGEQGGVGTLLLIYGVGATYLCFISLFLFSLWVYHLRHKDQS